MSRAGLVALVVAVLLALSATGLLLTWRRPAPATPPQAGPGHTAGLTLDEIARHATKAGLHASRGRQNGETTLLLAARPGGEAVVTVVPVGAEEELTGADVPQRRYQGHAFYGEPRLVELLVERLKRR
jgi:hypothetical protein